MQDTDRLLIGTTWTRKSSQKHHPIVGIIDQMSQRGPRLKTGSNYHRIVWAELDFSWEPTDARSKRAWELWRMASHINYLDKKDAEMKQIIAEAQTPIEREIELPTNGSVTMESPEVAVKECHGAWHKTKDGYTLIPLTEFTINTTGKRAGEPAAICNGCKEKYAAAPSAKRRGIVPKFIPESAVIEPKVETSEGTYYRWKVTVIQTVEHIVQGKDLLDVAAQAENLGRVIKVEQL